MDMDLDISYLDSGLDSPLRSSRIEASYTEIQFLFMQVLSRCPQPS